MAITSSTIYRSSVSNSYTGICTACNNNSSRTQSQTTSSNYGRSSTDVLQQSRSQIVPSTYSRSSTCPTCGKSVQSGSSCPTCNSSNSRSSSWNSTSTSYYTTSASSSCPTCGNSSSQSYSWNNTSRSTNYANSTNWAR
ncbi:MAG: hypothetical protein LBE18_11720 [Planctomycetaceae bacterium]|nr:hypothetical protein [Planctomycetaceae bacterium]